ncbi:MAG: SDR family oxidoreductase [Candidatus Aminicenantales bacterium]
MDLGLDEKTALVAASSRGLGKAIAYKLSSEGANAVICARGKEKLMKTKEEISAETGKEVKAFAVDVRDRDQVKSMVEETVREYGAIDILVTNAGGPPAGLIEDFSPQDYRQALELNLMSTINLCYEVISIMKERRWGRIIIMTSISAKQPIDNLILSNTARAGVLGFSKSLSNQLGRFGITVNSVCPGYTKTERVEELAQDFEEKGRGTIDDFYRKIEKDIPLGRLGKPEEIASAVAFLASEGAAYITGVALQVDGGYIKALY